MEPSQTNKWSLPIALLLAFVPAAMVLILIATGGTQLKQDALFALALLTGVCCFVSSFMLFRRRTALWIVAGILFMIVNGIILLGFGCASCFAHN